MMRGSVKSRQLCLRGVLAAAVLLIATGCEPLDGDSGLSHLDAKVPATFVAHKSRDGAGSLKAPPAWQETPTSGVIVLNLKTERPRSSVNLVVVPSSAGETLDRTMAQLPEQLGHEFADFKLVQRDYLIVNDRPVGRIVYEGSRNGFHGKLAQFVIVKGGRDYVLSYTATPDTYEDEYPTVEQVLASLEI
jgi:hypothetical protein